MKQRLAFILLALFFSSFVFMNLVYSLSSPLLTTISHANRQPVITQNRVSTPITPTITGTYPILMNINNISLYPSNANISTTYLYPTPSGSSYYPIPFPTYTLSYSNNYPLNVPGIPLTQAQRGHIYILHESMVGEASFSWGSWNGSGSISALIASLTPPGNSEIYINPYDPSDNILNIGDWVSSTSGNMNAIGVAPQLENYINTDIPLRVITYDQVIGTGVNTTYRIAGFATIYLRALERSTINKYLVIEFVEWSGPPCVDTPPTAVFVTPTINNNDLILTWQDDPTNLGGYHIHHSNQPYFTPVTSTLKATLPMSSTTYTDTGIIAQPDNNFYIVQAQNCESSEIANSNRIGTFQYALNPGD